MSIQESIAVIGALDVVRTVLGDYMPTECAAYEAAEVGLELPAPSIYRMSLSRSAVDEALGNAAVAAFIFQSRPSEIVAESSGDALHLRGVQLTYVEIRIVYRMRNQAPYTPASWGSELTSSDTLARRGYYYAAAVNEVMRTQLCCNSGGIVSEVISKDSDYAGAIYESDSQKIYAMTTLVYGLRQDILIPYC
jgi:hypothetical protein